MTRKISGIILAGGAGTRFDGRIKPKIVIEGETIVSRIISVVRDVFDEIIIVAGNSEEFKEFNDCRIIPDEIPNAGPLGGIHAAIRASANDAIFVLAGDMPYPDKGLIIRLIEDYHSSGCDVLIPQIGKFIEPLHAIYSISLAEHLDHYLKTVGTYAVRDYVKTLNVKYFQLEMSETNRKAFTNINSPEDLELQPPCPPNEQSRQAKRIIVNTKLRRNFPSFKS